MKTKSWHTQKDSSEGHDATEFFHPKHIPWTAEEIMIRSDDQRMTRCLVRLLTRVTRPACLGFSRAPLINKTSRQLISLWCDHQQHLARDHQHDCEIKDQWHHPNTSCIPLTDQQQDRKSNEQRKGWTQRLLLMPLLSFKTFPFQITHHTSIQTSPVLLC